MNTPKITVGNVRNGLLPDHDHHLYCGRGNTPKGMKSTNLGNPFNMNGEGTRNAVCDKYASWIKNGFSHDHQWVIQMIAQRINEGNSIALYCWCAPKRCHADTIKQMVLDHLA